MLAFIVAMDKEAEPFLKKATLLKEDQRGYALIRKLSYEKKDFVLVRSGIGKAFASAAVAALVGLYPEVDHLVNIGVAGALDNDVALFDTIIATSLVEHDLDTSAIGDPKGLVSGINLVNLPTDPMMNKRLEKASFSAGKTPRFGVISSGDTFYDDLSNKQRIKKQFHSLANDMEGAPIAQIAYVYHLPYSELRVISDALNAKEEYPHNAPIAAALAAEISFLFLKDYR